MALKQQNKNPRFVTPIDNNEVLGTKEISSNTNLDNEDIFSVDTSNVIDQQLSSSKEEVDMFSVDTSTLGGLDTEPVQQRVTDLSAFDEAELATRVGAFTGDPTEQLAASQSGLAQAAAFIPRTGAKMVYGLAETIGIIGDATMDWDSNDYSNALTEWAKEGQKNLDKGSSFLPGLYRENPNAVFDIADPAWWFQNGEGLVSSIGQFAITGYGLGSAFKGLGQAGASIIGTAKAAQTANGAAALLTAGSLSYIEGAMEGANVYKNIYDTAIKQGKTNLQANKIASDAAAHTTYINTAINTLLNFGAVSPYFKSQSQLAQLSELGLQRNAGETLADWGKRLTLLSKDNPALQKNMAKFWAHTGIEGAKESLEELVNLGSATAGTYRGLENLNALSDEQKQDGELYSSIKSVFTEEGALNALLGFAGGLGQTSFELMAKPTIKGGKLKFEPSNYTRQLQEKQQAADRIIANITGSINQVTSLQQQLKEAVKVGDEAKVEILQDQLFNMGVAKHLMSNTEPLLTEMMEDIANTDNKVEVTPGKTQAMVLGYTNSKDDNSYKDKAKKAIEKIKEQKKDFDYIMNKYNTQDVNRYPYGSSLYNLHRNRKTADDKVTEYDSVINKLEDAIKKESDVNALSGSPRFKTVQINNDLAAIEASIEFFKEKRDQVKQKSANNETKGYLFDEYGTVNVDEINKKIDKAVENLNKERDRQTGREREFLDTFFFYFWIKR